MVTRALWRQLSECALIFTTVLEEKTRVFNFEKKRLYHQTERPNYKKVPQRLHIVVKKTREKEENPASALLYKKRQNIRYALQP